MSIGSKLLISFITIFICIAGIVTFSVIGLFNIKDESNNIVGDAIPLSNAANDILTGLINQETAVRGYIVTGKEEFLEPYYAGEKQVNKNLAIINKRLDNHPIMAELIAEAMPHINTIQEYFKSQISLVKEGKMKEAQNNIANGKVAFDKFRAIHHKIYKDTLKLTDNAWVRTEDQVSKSLIIIMSITASIILLTTGVYIYLISNISKPVKRLIGTLRETIKENFIVTSKDEIKVLQSSIENLIKSVKNTIDSTKTSALQVASSADQLTASAEQTTSATEHLSQLAQQNSEGAEVQLSKINEASKSLDKMVQFVETINSDSIKMNNSTKVSTDYVDKGIQSVQQVVRSMDEIKEAFGNMSTSINSLSDRSNKIGNILEIITNISNQTNLLSLNATIEAARAGAQGKGFAVVADEIRQLAEESKRSADKISQMIGDIQKDTLKTVSLISEGTIIVKQGVEATKEADQSFEQINQSIKDVSSKVENVTLSIQDIEQISANLSILIASIQSIAVKNSFSNQDSSAATQQQLATMEEISSSAKSLNFLAEELQKSISQFKL
ncbi:methyl-accepting chemotaxis protein [Priestia koreensis]|uniref:methyl-accepting chemotaxis protein n=1 Tax=Priestia koreensis TaxID=284581 RepID=UPI001F58448D|nr:methyl-accepting chemotaxis protein [Priestia koreensis]UNL86063.1 CHASE3 domain-containing protein [Priestia koreensis]